MRPAGYVTEAYVTARGTNYATITLDGRPLPGVTAISYSDRVTTARVTPARPVPIRSRDTLRVTLTGTTAGLRPTRFEVVSYSRKRALRQARLRRATVRRYRLRAVQLSARTPQRGGPCSR